MMNNRITKLENNLKTITSDNDKSNDFCARSLEKINSQMINISQINEDMRKEFIVKLDKIPEKNKENIKEEFVTLSDKMLNKLENEMKSNDICKKDLESTQAVAKYVTTALESIEKCTNKWQGIFTSMKNDQKSNKASLQKLEKNLNCINELKKKISE